MYDKHQKGQGNMTDNYFNTEYTYKQVVDPNGNLLDKRVLDELSALGKKKFDKVQIHFQDNFTTCLLFVDKKIIVGVTKRMPKDEFILERAIKTAISRAIHNWIYN
jgi:hypothetical protein